MARETEGRREFWLCVWGRGERIILKWVLRRKILPGVLYGCETWPLTLREERRLRVFENRVLRRV